VLVPITLAAVEITTLVELDLQYNFKPCYIHVHSTAFGLSLIL